MYPLIGLKIDYECIPGKQGESQLLIASVSVAKGIPSKNFLTSPIIRKSLEEANFKVGENFGGIVLEHFPLEKRLNIVSYYPLPQNRGTPNIHFVGKGIAERIGVKVEEKARKVFVGFEKVTHSNPSKYRLEQLKNRGFSVWEVYKGIKGKDFTSTLRRKTAIDLFKHRRIKLVR